MADLLKLEKRIVVISVVFVLVLFGLAAAAINLYSIGLPTCLTDIKPFQKGEVITHSPTHYEVHYVAKMWDFEPADVVVPAGSTVDVYVSAKDVTHGLIMLGTNLNLTAVPGVVNYARLKLDKPQSLELLCHEYCGTGHDRMAARLRVVDRESYRPEAVAGPPAAGENDPAYHLLDTKECLSCHSVDGSEGIGPTLKGIYGRETRLTNGKTVTADEAYLREAIVHPDATIVSGFDNLMPKPELTDEEVNEIIDYLKKLK